MRLSFVLLQYTFRQQTTVFTANRRFKFLPQPGIIFLMTEALSLFLTMIENLTIQITEHQHNFVREKTFLIFAYCGHDICFHSCFAACLQVCSDAPMFYLS